MSNTEIALGLAGLALVLIPWGLDKASVRLPNWIYLAVVFLGALLLLLALVLTLIDMVAPPESLGLKPVIDVEPIGISNLAPGYKIGVTVEFTNRGRGVAYDVTSDVAIGILPFPLPQGYPMPPVATSHASKAILSGNGGRIQGFGQTDAALTYEQVKAIEDGTTLRLYVAGTLSYRIGPKQKCHRHFLMQTGGPELMNALHRFMQDKSTKPPFWMLDRFNDLTPECE